MYVRIHMLEYDMLELIFEKELVLAKQMYQKSAIFHYRIHFWYMSKNDAININNSNRNEKS